MSTVTTTKPIDLAQLSTELGGAELTATTTGTQTVIESYVTQTALAAAVAAHIAPDRVALDANEATIRSQAGQALATNGAFLAFNNPTNAQVVAQVKALTRQNNGLIRLALRRFDATN